MVTNQAHINWRMGHFWPVGSQLPRGHISYVFEASFGFRCMCLGVNENEAIFLSSSLMSFDGLVPSLLEGKDVGVRLFAWKMESCLTPQFYLKFCHSPILKTSQVFDRYQPVRVKVKRLLPPWQVSQIYHFVLNCPSQGNVTPRTTQSALFHIHELSGAHDWLLTVDRVYVITNLFLGAPGRRWLDLLIFQHKLLYIFWFLIQIVGSITA